MLFSAISCYLVLFSVIYYILLGLTEIIKFLFGHFPAVNIFICKVNLIILTIL